jgi:hypothetical protein
MCDLKLNRIKFYYADTWHWQIQIAIPIKQQRHKIVVLEGINLGHIILTYFR